LPGERRLLQEAIPEWVAPLPSLMRGKALMSLSATTLPKSPTPPKSSSSSNPKIARHFHYRATSVKKPTAKRLVTKAVQSLGGLDIVVSNAGRQRQCEDILQLTTEAFDATMKTNIYAPFWIIKAAVPHMRPGACIIATTSEQAYDPAGNLYDYAQTKAATMNFVKSLAEQLGPKGIRVNGVAPGPIWTPLQVSGGATQEHLISLRASYPLRRAGQPAELASIYVQLAANDASYTTGNIYGAGGGAGQP
jgi:NAD(P)-dependent dehydrogenase (short-subunit alcohol dehydrogenase family)